MSIFGNFFKKEAPLLGLQGSGGGLGFLAGGGGNPVQVTGGTQTTIGSYLFVEFENGMPGTFTVDSGETEEAVIMLAGGGGAGGCQVGGGGGAGGLVFRNDATLTPGTYTYTVGAGGGAVSYPPGQNGGNGSPTTITFPGSHPYGNVTNTALGGGGGGGHNTPGAQQGGCGGGGGAPPDSQASGIQPGQTNTGWSQWGYPGGHGRQPQWAGGGGGGASHKGGDSPGADNGGGGGNGRGFPEIPPAFGDNGLFCGGGGGCRNGSSGSNGSAGPGGGGQGGGDESINPMELMHGDNKTGGGGGGRRDNGQGSGRGGTGVIIIRVPA